MSRRFASQVRSWGKVGQILLVLLILTSFAAVQAASVIEIFPDHHGAHDRCCAGGHAGHFPILVSVNAVQIETLCVAGWHAGIELDSYYSDDGRTFNSSRAPPA
ncbi:MAG TPA: hypothetical protein VL127_02600 [Bryobacteraceae bacterium]|nr:hypothetical protein [Bryobacteraceae bacterium]